MEINIERFLQENSSDNFITISTCKKASSKYELSYHEVEKIALQNGLLPLRYKRNQTTISFENQLKLLNAHVAIIGCGGLGGHIAENLARIGVGKMTLYDLDVFEEHNLNRQNFSNYDVIGKEKVYVVKKECERINPSLRINAHYKEFTVAQDFKEISNVDVVIDALDNPALKLELAFTCKENNLPFVHGAIAGFNTQHASCISLEHLYKNGSKGIETSVGNPAFTVSFAASLQSLECVKLILGLKENLEGKILLCNLLENEFILLDN
jgi:molybdopterin/thiamine biosynthesis adenylyltransferase